jgi:hypothetical protein
VRQLHDAKIKPLVESFNAEMLEVYSMACGWVLARAHAKASALASTISGYLGSSNDEFDIAMGKFALAYADQTERDHAILKTAVQRGKLTICVD